MVRDRKDRVCSKVRVKVWVSGDIFKGRKEEEKGMRKTPYKDKTQAQGARKRSKSKHSRPTSKHGERPEEGKTKDENQDHDKDQDRDQDMNQGPRTKKERKKKEDDIGRKDLV